MRVPSGHTIIHVEQPPGDLTVRQALAALYHLQQWEKAQRPPPAAPYGHGMFYNQVPGVWNGLTNVSRSTVLKHVDTRQCFAYACTTPVALRQTVLDHLIPRAQGGPEGLENSAMLCRQHNSSKGHKDLCDWWGAKGWPATALPHAVIVLYTRIHWQVTPDAVLSAPAAPGLVALVQGRAAALPSDAHRVALYGAAYAVSCYRYWVQQGALL